jgi:hypothetical protein
MLLEINSLQENALKEHVQLNKENEVEVFDINYPFLENEDEVNKLKNKFEGIQMHALYLEGGLEAKEGAKKGSSNGGVIHCKRIYNF